MVASFEVTSTTVSRKYWRSTQRCELKNRYFLSFWIIRNFRARVSMNLSCIRAQIVPLFMYCTFRDNDPLRDKRFRSYLLSCHNHFMEEYSGFAAINSIEGQLTSSPNKCIQRIGDSVVSLCQPLRVILAQRNHAVANR